MLLRCKKKDLLVVLIFSCLGIFMLKKPAYYDISISHRFSANVSTNEGIEFDYIIDALSGGKLLLQSTLKVGDKSYDYTRLFELVKIEENVFVINETGIGEKQDKVVEQASKYDFFHSVQRLEVYTLSPKVLVVHSEGKFILLQKTSDNLGA
ncbi:hypothetical protein ACOMICROBIO_NCLOACGD_04118 [Vibrio sp. B1ASS3]|nr:hypothetical protein ACOMICROBIO_NCLOACGD_04118 [Vibrio sp. B1ASS3]CAE6947060.1 hypothetical protein ACOMICROBIO_NCLOACGD_04118 [Vibrio sp. B1ASS3]